MKNDMINIKNISIRRGGRVVLEADELNVEKGEVLAVVGPNGAGKSTLLLTLARLLKPERGEIWFNGKPTAAESALHYRRRIGLVMQDPLLFDMSVHENVAAGLKFRGVAKKEIGPRVEKWLEQLGISHLAGRRANELSGGEAQRVSLARAFVLEPELLLLDEPFAALDPPTHAKLLEDLSNILKQDHKTAVFVTHNLNEAAKLSHRIAVVVNGVLRQVGTARQIKSHPADETGRTFLSELSQ